MDLKSSNQFFLKKDLEIFKKKGISLKKINKQLDSFKNGLNFINIVRPATIKDGILKLSIKEEQHYTSTFQNHFNKIKIQRFVPASGYATRMFKHLFEFLNLYNGNCEQTIKKHNLKEVQKTIDNLHLFAFYDDLEKMLSINNLNIKKLLANKDYKTVIEYILFKKGLSYYNFPKGLIKFHKYQFYTRKATFEHLNEIVNYTKNDQVNIHFSVSPLHEVFFIENVESEKEILSQKFRINFNISYSKQCQSTDTIAVNLDNSIYRDVNKNILFRAGGHGSLIKNLNNIDADIISIKNIDNILPEHKNKNIIYFQKILTGFLLEKQKQIFEYLELLETEISKENLKLILKFIRKDLNIEFSSTNVNQKDIIEVLNRPIRVCGMVENKSDVGGGPFWVKDKIKSQLQIVEKAQINLNNSSNRSILERSTHFNPVDLVCGIKDYKGNSFDLLQFVDKNTSFISEKHFNGKKIKALELPGLWNGSMANWNTIFIEIPYENFNPVKTLNDLLEPKHQP